MSTTSRLRLVLWVTFLLSVLGNPLLAHGADLNAVQVENMMAGTTEWQLGGIVADDVSGQIKGYASTTSVAQGSAITFYVSVNPAQTFTMDFYRIGWYQGLGGRMVAGSGPLSGRRQAACRPAAGTGLIDCGWAASYTVTVPPSWTSGIYLARLRNALGYENYIDFAVRDGRWADLLYQMPVNTYQAYNNYPDDNVNGKSLYEFNSFGANTVAGTPRAVKVSFNRPYADSGVGDFLNWEIDFVRWIEGSGYDITYATDVDTHENAAMLPNSRGFLSVGHDEYWTKPMRDAVEAARGAGVNLAFFGANDVFWQVRYEAARGVADRTIVCYKDAGIDPVQGPTTTVNWRSAPVNRPEQTLLGVQFTSMVNWGNNVPYVVTNSWHPAYANTGFADGDSVTQLVGYEMDRFMIEYPAPAGTGHTLLSQSPFINVDGFSDYSNAAIYQAPGGAWVFTAGTSSWAYGLDSYTGPGADWRIQQMTTNLMDTFAGLVVPLGGPPMATAPMARVALPGTPKARPLPTGIPKPPTVP